MSLLYDASTDQIRGVAPSSITNFTIIGRAYIVSNRGSGTIQSLVTMPSSLLNDVLAYLSWNEGVGSMAIGSYDGTSSNESTFASRPAVGSWFWYYLRCSGSGAGALQGGFMLDGSDTITTQTQTLTATAAGRTPVRIDFSSVVFSTDWANARISHCRAWNAVLTDAEVRLEFNNNAAVRTANLIFDCPADQGSVALSLLDYSGNNNPLTESGTAVAVDGSVDDILHPAGQHWMAAASGQNYSKTLQEELIVVDDLARSIRVSRQLDEPLSMSDNLIFGTLRGRTLDEVTSATDLLDRGVAYSRQLDDGIIITDDLTVYRLLSRLISEELTIIDDLARTITTGGNGQQYTILLSETLDVIDDLSRQIVYSRRLEEPVVASDELIIGRLRVTIVDDSVVTTDLLNASMLRVRGIDESVAVIDELRSSSWFYRLLSEELSIVDELMAFVSTPITGALHGKGILNAQEPQSIGVEAINLIGARYPFELGVD